MFVDCSNLLFFGSPENHSTQQFSLNKIRSFTMLMGHSYTALLGIMH